jgi:hypothetical protein
MDEKTKAKPKASEWPNPIRNRDKLDEALEIGLKSGVADENIEQITKRVFAARKHG